jgi:hypothetical protein
MRNVARLKMGYYPLPVAEGVKLRSLLSFDGPASLIDPQKKFLDIFNRFKLSIYCTAIDLLGHIKQIHPHLRRGAKHVDPGSCFTESSPFCRLFSHSSGRTLEACAFSTVNRCWRSLFCLCLLMPCALSSQHAGRDVLTLPHRTQFDMGLFKTFPIHEDMHFEFRTEAFNVFNHSRNSSGCLLHLSPASLHIPDSTNNLLN